MFEICENYSIYSILFNRVLTSGTRSQVGQARGTRVEDHELAEAAHDAAELAALRVEADRRRRAGHLGGAGRLGKN